MNKLEVIKECIKLRYNEEEEAWGFYPYVILEQSRLGAITFNVLDFDLVEIIYELAKEKLRLFPKELHIILDFASSVSSGGDMDNDFVAIISCESDITDLDSYSCMASIERKYYVSVVGLEYNAAAGGFMSEYRMVEKETLKSIAIDFIHAIEK